MKQLALILVCIAAISCALVLEAQESKFLPGHLAVLRAGNGQFELTLKQSPIFIDQFDPSVMNAGPTVSVAIPTNGPSSFFFNGHAASEGNLARSADRKLLTFSGYGGVDLLAVSGTASRIPIRHGFGTVDKFGAFHSYLYRLATPEAKVNARGGVTDGTNNFWACGNASGTLYFNESNSSPVLLNSLPESRAIKIINGALYASLNAADGELMGKESGIYKFASEPLPRTANATANLVVPAAANYKKIASFDVNTNETVAYMADISAGVQKYVKTQGKWSFAYNFSIPQTIASNLNSFAGCFALVVDFNQQAPIIYATTTEGYGGSVNSNRVVRIVDTNATAAVVTIAQATSTNVAFRGIEFTPE